MLGLGLGLGVGNKAPLLPASAFPTVADIPPGMVVLDEYGELWVSDGTTLISVTAYLHNEFGDILMNEFDEPIMAQYE